MVKLTGERRALSAAVLAMYGFLYLLVSIQIGEDWGPAFAALAGLYGLGFLGVVAGYFWARWFAIGLGISGFLTGAISLVQMGGIEETLLFYALSHLAITILLWGNAMANLFDGRKEWRAKFHLDEYATNRLGKSVIRVGVSLPYVVLFAFAPREDAAMLAIFGGTLSCVAAWGMSRMRSWAIPAFVVGAIATLVAVAGPAASAVSYQGSMSSLTTSGTHVGFLGLVGASVLMLAMVPFAKPTWNLLRGK